MWHYRRGNRWGFRKCDLDRSGRHSFPALGASQPPRANWFLMGRETARSGPRAGRSVGTLDRVQVRLTAARIPCCTRNGGRFLRAPPLTPSSASGCTVRPGTWEHGRAVARGHRLAGATPGRRTGRTVNPPASAATSQDGGIPVLVRPGIAPEPGGGPGSCSCAHAGDPVSRIRLLAALPSSFWAESRADKWRFLLLSRTWPARARAAVGHVAALIGVALGLWPRVDVPRLLCSLLQYHLAPGGDAVLESGGHGRTAASRWRSSPLIGPGAFAPMRRRPGRCGDRRPFPLPRCPPAAMRMYGWPLLPIPGSIRGARSTSYGGYASSST
jgi:hypothetical protein